MRCALGGLVLVAGCQLVFPLEKAPPDARDDAGQPTRRRKITITNPTLTALNEFPVSITTENDLDLMTHASENGGDLIFVLGGSVALAKEIVRFDKATGTLDAWVRIPDLQPGANEIHLEYGGADAASPGPVWDPATFYAVWHMSDVGQTENDRVPGNARPMIAANVGDAPDTTAGIAGLARDYRMTNQSLCTTNEFTVGADDGVTFSLWVRFTESITTNLSPFSAGGFSNRGFSFEIDTLSYLATAHDGTNQLVAEKGYAFTPSPRWYHLGGVIERGPSLLRLYLDGFENFQSGGTLGDVTTNIERPCLGSPFIGFIDEARVYRRPLHPHWIEAEFQNLSARPAFVKIDDPQ